MSFFLCFDSFFFMQMHLEFTRSKKEGGDRRQSQGRFFVVLIMHWMA
jgi:hypothetical protein